MDKAALIVMAKRPFPGRTKTRLTTRFTAQEAAELYACFLLDALEQVRAVADVQPFIAYTPADAETNAYFSKLAPDFGLLAQEGATLGERLDSVLMAVQMMGYMYMAAMNSDSPTLPPAYLQQAFARLEDTDVDVVLGPCEDGGYYLIGWKTAQPRLVREVEMSTAHVLADTLALAEEEKLSVSLLPVWYDVDDLNDLSRVRRELLSVYGAGGHTRRFLAEMRLLKNPEDWQYDGGQLW